MRGRNGRQKDMAPGVLTPKQFASLVIQDSLMDIPAPPSSMRRFKWISSKPDHPLSKLPFRLLPSITVPHPKPLQPFSSMLKLKPSLCIRLLLLPLPPSWIPQLSIGLKMPPPYPLPPYFLKINLAVTFQLFTPPTPTPSAR